MQISDFSQGTHCLKHSFFTFKYILKYQVQLGLSILSNKPNETCHLLKTWLIRYNRFTSKWGILILFSSSRIEETNHSNFCQIIFFQDPKFHRKCFNFGKNAFSLLQKTFSSKLSQAHWAVMLEKPSTWERLHQWPSAMPPPTADTSVCWEHCNFVLKLSVCS